MTGMHRSPYQGFSVEFAQHRQYAPGDDTRFLDWKVFGKTDKLYLKQYQKETNLDMILLVDVSGSMGYSSSGLRVQSSEFKKRSEVRKLETRNAERGTSIRWRKYDHAATLAAAMAHLALRQQDRVGLMLFAQDLRHATRLSNSQGHWRSITEALSAITFEDTTTPRGIGEHNHANDHDHDAPRTDFASLFDRVVAKLTQRSLIVVISDLFDDPVHLERGLARLHHRRHDVILLQTLDPAELTFPFRSPSEFIGLEAEGRLPLDPAALRTAYLNSLKNHMRQIEEIARKFRFDYLMLDTAKPLGPPLSHFLAHRAAGIAKG